ncbi:hypothetical protein EIP86_004129 [Pleurotus ostreatoroseus]|nr:hypothetical protein EIP86_004129 [Pleurotus ostreatoroseus]
MVFIASLLGAALFAGAAHAAPRPDSAIGPEVAVSAPNGVILSDTAALASETALASDASGSYPAAATAAYSSVDYSNSYSSSVDYSNSYSSSVDYSNSYSSSVDSYNAYSSSSAYDSIATDLATSTYSASSSMMTYGSGSYSWGGSGYDDCINQCVAEFGTPPPSWTPPPSTTTYTGSGAVHTVIVAPMQGVLRFVPPFINASVGDTVHFEWHANNHTVTKSSELELCNKTSNAPFASGEQNSGFTFDQVVNDTNPVFYYCGTPGHCQKGMFGVINPPAGFVGSPETVDAMMPSMVSNSSTLSAMMSYANSLNGSASAMSWGGAVNMSAFPAWSQSYVMENVLYARALFAKNPDIMGADGKVDMSAGGNPIQFPQDLAAVISSNAAVSNDASSSSSSASAASSTAASMSGSMSMSASSSGSAASATATNGAGHVAASGALLSVAAIVASLLAL